ncbi:sphingomyelin phosphodiesterase [Gautieria morchelliformis]|nr:sphingomyelin phosphodiesterase [Gautieria morchelliformis]
MVPSHWQNASTSTAMQTLKQFALTFACLGPTLAQEATLTFGPSTFTAPGAFPTSAYSKYFNSPTATSAQVQPVISDPVLHKVYPAALTGPKTIPVNNTDPHPLPPKASSSLLLETAFEQVVNINANPVFGSSTCTKCIASLEVVKFVALTSPELVPPLAIRLCNQFKLSSTCEAMYALNGLGSVITQVVANADVGGYDGQLFCQNFFSACPLPPTSPLNLDTWFQSPKPNPLPAPKKPSGQRLKVLHLSDFHLDPRYATGSEGNCTNGLCCRDNNPNPAFPGAPSLPAPRFGTFLCDTPYALALSALEAIPVLSGTEKTGFAFSVFTGDLVSHDPDNQLSRDYVEYTETVLYDLYRNFLGSGPVYAALGNHDSYNQAQDAPHALGGQLASQFSWNYDHVSGLWAHEDWLPQGAVQQAKAHYAAYSVQRQDGLRVITLNTDLWYRANYFNYINLTNSDNSGMLRFLTDELHAAEDAGDRVWILGHVLSGWDGTNPLENPTNLFYQIVDRFTPHVIANIFFGHTHEDEFSIFYANNATNISAETAGTVSWVGPSITPLTNLNSGFRVYEVDSSTFDILDAHTWFSNVSTYPPLDSQIANGPTYSFEYSTRDTYGPSVPGWGANDPLNATWWHHVTEAMLANTSLVSTFTTFQGKSSVLSPPCVSTNCTQAKVCYMRSGSASIAKQNCIPGFGSVQ